MRFLSAILFALLTAAPGCGTVRLTDGDSDHHAVSFGFYDAFYPAPVVYDPLVVVDDPYYAVPFYEDVYYDDGFSFDFGVGGYEDGYYEYAEDYSYDGYYDDYDDLFEDYYGDGYSDDSFYDDDYYDDDYYDDDFYDYEYDDGGYGDDWF